MWTRKELKTKAKAAFKRNYWACVAVALILSLLVGGTSTAVSSKVNSAGNVTPEEAVQQVISETAAQNGVSEEQAAQAVAVLATVVLGVVSVIAFVAAMLKIFVWNVLEVGGAGFFSHNAMENAKIGELFGAFSHGYGHKVGVMLLRSVFIALWSLLFVIPGIVKTYAYRMIPYILAENPEMGWAEASRLSQDMMKGNKWHAFVLDLSFIGWHILSSLTLGILTLFYVNPYIQATNAELYHALRNPQA